MLAVPCVMLSTATSPYTVLGVYKYYFLRFWGSGGQGFQKVLIFTPKGTSFHVV